MRPERRVEVARERIERLVVVVVGVEDGSVERGHDQPFPIRMACLLAAWHNTKTVLADGRPSVRPRARGEAGRQR